MCHTDPQFPCFCGLWSEYSATLEFELHGQSFELKLTHFWERHDIIQKVDLIQKTDAQLQTPHLGGFCPADAAHQREPSYLNPIHPELLVYSTVTSIPQSVVQLDRPSLNGPKQASLSLTSQASHILLSPPATAFPFLWLGAYLLSCC